jgi:general secretion pathway protein I
VRHARREGGFSLVEMLAALIIFALGVMSVLEVVATSVQSTTATAGYTEAVFLARQRVEETIATEGLAPVTDSGDFGEAYPRHSWKRVVEEVDPGRLYRIRVDVTWDDRGIERQYTLATLAANRQ